MSLLICLYYPGERPNDDQKMIWQRLPDFYLKSHGISQIQDEMN